MPSPRTFVLGLASLLAACGAAAPHPRDLHLTPAPVAPPGAPDFANRIDDEATWASIAAHPEDETFAHTEVVKFLLDLEDGHKIYFVQSDRWSIHYDFARRFLDTDGHHIEDHWDFNVREYRRDDRRFFLGSIVRYRDANIWALELIAGDTVSADLLRAGFADLQRATFFGPTLRFHPLSAHQESLASELAARVPSVDTYTLVGTVRYQPVTLGTAFGYVRIVHGALDFAQVRRNEILVVDDVPDDLPSCAGFVTSNLQAPLAHVAVLSAGRHTPNMAVRGAVDAADFTRLDGQLVRLEVAPQEYRLEPASIADATAAWQRDRPGQTSTPTLDTSRTDLVDVCNLAADDIAFAGAKAAQLGAVCGIDGVHTPGGFVVPMHAYVDHLHRTHADGAIDAILADPALAASTTARDAALTRLRATIADAPVDPRLVAAVRARIQSFPAGRVIFRSSTNAEDLAGFNGAGLYDSIVVDPPLVAGRAGAISDAQIASALARVWASVWTLRGYDERQWFRVDHRRVAMAVLVQPFISDVIALGVAITANPFYADRPGVFINVQARGGSVTAAGNEVPEQHIVYTYSEELEDEIVSRSSLTHGQPVLDSADVLSLARVLKSLHDTLVPSWGDRANAADVEFVVSSQHQVVILQARPYTVVYTPGRRYEGGESD